MSDDGFEGRETSTGSQRLSGQQFSELLQSQKNPSGSSLEERLLAAQAEGLAANLRRQIAFVGPNEPIFEFQALGVRRHANDSFERVWACHARGIEEAIALCTEAEKWFAHGIYMMPARLKPGVESRHSSPGRWFEIPGKSGTTDSDVDARLILAVDFDVKRVRGISATEEQMQTSVRVAQNAWNYLAHHLGEASLAYVHSGNGRQIHIALDMLPAADEQIKNTCAGLLTGLAQLFNSSEIEVDEKVFDAKRILPACGTLKKKGAPNIPDRPHRRTAVVTPNVRTRVPLDTILNFARYVWESTDHVGRAKIEKSFGVKPQTTHSVTPIRGTPYRTTF